MGCSVKTFLLPGPRKSKAPTSVLWQNRLQHSCLCLEKENEHIRDMGGRTGMNCAFRSLCWVCLQQNQQMMQFSPWQRLHDIAERIPSVLITPQSRAVLWNCSHWAKLLWRNTAHKLRAEQVHGGFMHITPAPELPSSQNMDGLGPN